MGDASIIICPNILWLMDYLHRSHICMDLLKINCDDVHLCVFISSLHVPIA